MMLITNIKDIKIKLSVMTTIDAYKAIT